MTSRTNRSKSKQRAVTLNVAQTSEVSADDGFAVYAPSRTVPGVDQKPGRKVPMRVKLFLGIWFGSLIVIYLTGMVTAEVLVYRGAALSIVSPCIRASFIAGLLGGLILGAASLLLSPK